MFYSRLHHHRGTTDGLSDQEGLGPVTMDNRAGRSIHQAKEKSLWISRTSESIFFTTLCSAHRCLQSGDGAVLSQEASDGILTPAEMKYSTVEKEELAVKWAVGMLHYYLLHNPFTLWVGHEPLKWMMQMKDHNACILHWYLSLLPFSFTVRHRS